MEIIKCLNRKKYKFYERNFLILNMMAGTCLKSWNGATKGWKSGTPKKQKTKTGGAFCQKVSHTGYEKSIFVNFLGQIGSKFNV